MKWDGTMPDGRRIVAGFRWDHPKNKPKVHFAIIKLFDNEAGKWSQLLQINAKHFESEAKAYEWMKNTAVLLAGGNITEEKACTFKDQFMASVVDSPTEAVIKRPAAACKRPAAAEEAH
eukprot:3903179-Pyramimonas_sp.AAC.1